MTATEQAALEYVELSDDEFGAYLEVALKETFSKPGTADVTPADRAKLKGLIAHYMKMEHPVTQCIKDQIKHGLSKDHAGARCAVLKDIGTGTTKWRGKEKAASETEDGDDVTVYELDMPEHWQEQFVHELADMPSAEELTATDDEDAEADDPERSLVERFLSWLRSEDKNHAGVELASGYEGECKQGDTVSFEQDGETVRGIVTAVNGEKVTVRVGDKTYTKTHDELSVGKSPKAKADKGSSKPNPFEKKMGEDEATDGAAYEAFLSPYLSDAQTEVVELADGKRMYWKQVLPLGKRIKYRDGKYLNTSKEFLAKLADNINASRWPAFFRLQGDGDGHSPNALNAAGVIAGARVTDKGLDVKIEPRTDEGRKHLDAFPEYPVSAFYAEDYVDRGTGERVGPRLFHVAAVERPYINEMAPTELVAAAEEEAPRAQVIDLSGSEYSDPTEQGKEAEVVSETTATETREEVQMTDDTATEVAAEETEQAVSYGEFIALQEALREERRVRASGSTLNWLRQQYPSVNEAGVQAAHRLLMEDWGSDEASVVLGEDGISLAEGDDHKGAARATHVKALLKLAEGTAPKVDGERGVTGGKSLGEGADHAAIRAEAQKRANEQSIPLQRALSEVRNERAGASPSGEVQA